MAMRKRPTITELKFDQKVEELQAYAAQAVSPFGDRSPKAKQERLARAEWDFEFFCQTYLPHYFEEPPADFHREMVEMAQVRPDFTKGEAVIPAVVGAPRGFGKSTPLAFAYPLWEALHTRRHCIIIGSETAGLSESHVASIAAECAGNRRILYDFAPVIESLKKGHLVLKDCSIFARGAGQQIRGIKHGSYRPDLVVLDDLENDKLAINPKRVKFLLRWILGTVYPGISRDGGLIIIGTIIDRRSALATMLTSQEDPWRLWRRKLYRAITPEGESLWPAMYSLELLESKKAAMGLTLFNQEYMNDPRNEAGLFQEEWIQTFDPDSPEFQAKLKAGHLIAGGFCDPSARTGESNDYKAVVTVFLDTQDMTYYVVDAFIRRCSPKTVALAIADREKRFGYWKFGIEDNGFQALFVKRWTGPPPRRGSA